VRTIFNFLGPLTNPAGATRQLIGVSDPAYLETVAGALLRLGVARALVVSSEDGLDEMSTAGRTQVVEVAAAADGGAPLFERYTVDATALGLARARAGGRGGGPPAQTAETTRRILAGEPGPRRDLAALNAGGAIYASGRVETLGAGLRAAEAARDDGAPGPAPGCIR